MVLSRIIKIITLVIMSITGIIIADIASQKLNQNFDFIIIMITGAIIIYLGSIIYEELIIFKKN